MNLTQSNSNNQVYAPMQYGMQDDEKNRIMQRVYSSDVFREFVRQWGDTMVRNPQPNE